MRKALVPVTSAGLSLRAEKVRQDSEAALRQFCIRKVIEHGLAPRTFHYQFQFPRWGGVDARRSIVKLKMLFGRAVEKRLPYVEYAQLPFIEIVNRECVRINLVSLPESFSGSERQFQNLTGPEKRDLAERSPYGKVIRRYARYLQFLCLKHALPFQFELRMETQRSPDSQREARNDRTANSTSRSPEIQYRTSILVRLSYWYPMDQIGTDLPISTFLERRLEALPESEVFNASNWTTYSVIHGRPNVTPKGIERYWTIEKLFFYIPQIITVLCTLTRKTSYVPSAFSIGAAESS